MLSNVFSVCAVILDHHIIAERDHSLFCRFQGVPLCCFLTGAVVEYFKTVNIHLVAILIYSVHINARRSHLSVQELSGRNMDAPGRVVPGNVCRCTGSESWVISLAWNNF